MAVETYAMYSDQDLSASANQIKELIVQTMCRKGIVSKEDSEDFMERHAIIVAKKGFLGSCVDKILGLKDKDDKVYTVVEITPKA